MTTKDIRTSRAYPSNSGVAKALNTFTARNWSVGSGSTTPTHSQPSSPMRKEASPFNFPSDARPTSAFSLPKRELYTTQKLQRLIQDRSQMNDGSGDAPIHSRTLYNPPTSPLRIIPSNESSTFGVDQRIASPVSQEDEEVVSIVKQGETVRHQLRQCDSVLQETEREEDLDDCVHEHGSPCTAGGLHMANSKSMNDFVKSVRRLRYHSQCAETEQQKVSTGSSPGNNSDPYPTNLAVRRANSCPEMKKSHVVAAIDNINKPLDETDEETQPDVVPNGLDFSDKKEPRKAKQIHLSTSQTQTENFFVMPYEHLFLDIFPSLENSEIKYSPAPSPAPLNLQQDKYSPPISVNEILDRYIEIAIQHNDRDAIKNFKDQLQLLHQQLLFERHRRETHAFRNRRLLADSRNIRAYEEHNSALRDQVQLQQKDIDSLREELECIKNVNIIKERKTADNVKFWESKYNSLDKECMTLREFNEHLKKQLEKVKEECADIDKHRQSTEAALLDATAEVKVAKEQAWAGERGRAELERLNKELLLAGELQLKYQERLSELSLLRRSDQELVYLTETYNHELKCKSQQLDNKAVALEACRTRISQLDQMLCQNDETLSLQKRTLNEVKEEYHETLKAVESKYQTQLSINRAMEEKILELWQKIELTRGGRAVYSPDTSSCHEVNATLTDRTSIATGLSPHSSPLSASLASSEGSAALMHPDVRDMKNLQVIVDQKEATAPSSVKSYMASENISISEAGPSAHQQIPSTKTD